MDNRDQKNRLGRNDPCWCGSGVKFKRCHLNRHRDSPPSRQEVITRFRKTYGKKYCLHPQASKVSCSSRIVQAHTIQRNGGLSRIARSGVVYTLRPNFTHRVGDDGLPQLTSMGTREASTFTGFCGFHDHRTFEPIENHPFESIPQHTFLLGYRALCRELFMKKSQLEFTPYVLSLDKGRSLQGQVAFQDTYRAFSEGVALGARDLSYHKSLYDGVLLSSDFASVCYYVVRFANVPDVMCSGARQVEYDFDGNVLQRLGNLAKVPDQVALSLIATETGGQQCLIGWVKAKCADDCSSP